MFQNEVPWWGGQPYSEPSPSVSVPWLDTIFDSCRFISNLLNVKSDTFWTWHNIIKFAQRHPIFAITCKPSLYIFENLIYKSQCVCACISAIEIQTTALILMKFGMEIVLNSGKVISWVATPYPYPWGQGGPKQGLACLCGLNRKTWWKHYKIKVVRDLCFSGGGSHFWTCNPDPEGPGPYVFLEPWSINFTHTQLL